jgi:hypothetical protein
MMGIDLRAGFNEGYVMSYRSPGGLHSRDSELLSC